MHARAETGIVVRRVPGGGGGRRVAARVDDARDVGRGPGQVVRIGPGDALAVDDVHPRAIGAERDVMRFVGGGDQAADGVRFPASERDHGDRVRSAVDRVQRLAVAGQASRAKRCRAGVLGRVGAGGGSSWSRD